MSTPVQNSGDIQQRPRAARNTVCLRGGYRFAIQAETGLLERYQTKVRHVHFSSFEFLPLNAASAGTVVWNCFVSFESSIESPTIPKPINFGLK
jgi:hypothetical protein